MMDKDKYIAKLEQIIINYRICAGLSKEQEKIVKKIME